MVQDAATHAVDVYADCLIEEEEELLAAWTAPDSPITVIEDVDVDAFREEAEAYLTPLYGDKFDGVYLDLIAD